MVVFDWWHPALKSASSGAVNVGNHFAPRRSSTITTNTIIIIMIPIMSLQPTVTVRGPPPVLLPAVVLQAVSIVARPVDRAPRTRAPVSLPFYNQVYRLTS